MASDLLSLADASALLGVSAERVRQLVVSGDLPAVRFGNAWAVPRDSVEARRHVSNRRGRPLNPRHAWAAIAGNDIDLSNTSRYRNRADVYRFEMSAADRAFLSGRDHALVSGVDAAAGYGELVQPDPAGVDLYVPASLHTELGSLVAAVPDQLGNTILRVVPDEVWSHVEPMASLQGEAGAALAPRAAVALDLMESGDPRHWVAAEQLVKAHG